MISNDIISVIRKSQSVGIMPHISADGDALGSSFALALTLEKMGKTVAIYLEEEIPYIYRFLPGKHLVGSIDNPQNHDAIIALDTGDMGRLGRRADIFSKYSVTINIDHHNTNSSFATYNYVDPNYSAVGEIIFEMIEMLGSAIDRDTALCIYVAIATDTGGFRFSNTTPLTHQIASDLVNKGVNVADVSQKVFDTVSFEKVKLIGKAIETIELVEDGKIALIAITDEMMRIANAKDEDCDGVVNIIRGIRGVQVAAVLKEWHRDSVKVNLRSSTDIDVSAVAGVFGGGGHKKAAGCTAKGNLHEVKGKLLEEIRRQMATGK